MLQSERLKETDGNKEAKKEARNRENGNILQEKKQSDVLCCLDDVFVFQCRPQVWISGLFKVCYFTINRHTEKFFACQVVWLTVSLIADFKK